MSDYRSENKLLLQVRIHSESFQEPKFRGCFFPFLKSQARHSVGFDVAHSETGQILPVFVSGTLCPLDLFPKCVI